MRVLFLVLVLLCLGLPDVSAAEDLTSATIREELLTKPPDLAVSKVEQKETTDPLTEPPRAMLIWNNREIIEFGTGLLGYTPEERVEAAQHRLDSALNSNYKGEITTQILNQSMVVNLDYHWMFFITPKDVNELEGETLQITGAKAVRNLDRAFREAREQRSIAHRIKATGQVMLATVVLGIIVTLLHKMRFRLPLLIQGASRWVFRKAGHVELDPLSTNYGLTLVERMALALFLLVDLVAVYTWLSFSLQAFPVTRRLGEDLSNHIGKSIKSTLMGGIQVIPNLMVAGMILLFVYCLNQLIIGVLRKIERGQIASRFLDEDTVPPTRRLVGIILWVFALVMIYPYLPGSNSEAFKAMGVMAGVMLSLGSSNLVGHFASGLILTYSRALRRDEYVRIGDTEGVVELVGMLSTKIRTPKKEVVSIPNSVIVGTTVKNYSKMQAQGGVILHTKITIGYNTPWRQVHEMLRIAATRTNGLLKTPKPFVLQTALNDWYVEYELNATMENPATRPATMGELHRNIQDVFNEYGVQIMSPHYIADPPDPAIVPKEKWFEAPARNPKGDDQSSSMH